MNTIYTSGLGYMSSSVISQSLGAFKGNSSSKIQGSGLKEQLDKKLEGLDLNSKNKNIKFSVD
jgi:hypothetical protein|tara:strand:- start:143 stop:331 length:189 start_codon:yes stop_codon:yes gene_type:complete